MTAPMRNTIPYTINAFCRPAMSEIGAERSEPAAAPAATESFSYISVIVRSRNLRIAAMSPFLAAKSVADNLSNPKAWENDGRVRTPLMAIRFYKK